MEECPNAGQMYWSGTKMAFGFTHQRTFDTRVGKGKDWPAFHWSPVRYDGKSRAPKRPISKAWQRNVDRDAMEGTTPLNSVWPLEAMEVYGLCEGEGD